MDCHFCHRPIAGTQMLDLGTGRSFHVLEDEYGNPAPRNIPSCWEKSAEGRLTLEEYLVELYANET